MMQSEIRIKGNDYTLIVGGDFDAPELRSPTGRNYLLMPTHKAAGEYQAIPVAAWCKGDPLIGVRFHETRGGDLYTASA
jgi:hypothetical protein